MITLNNSAPGAGWAGLNVEQIENPSVHARFDFLWNMVDTGETLILDCTYNTDLFDSDTVEKWMASYERLLRMIAAEPEVRIDALLGALDDADAESRVSKVRELDRARQDKFTKLKRKSQRTP